MDQSTLQRPALASEVRLHGELRGSGFVDRQWLIQRDSQYIQLTELLYRVLEQLDGKRSLEAIAASLTETTDWLVTANQVQQIIEMKLAPLHLVAESGRSAATRQSSTIREQSRSPLMINARVRILQPRAIELLTRVLQILFAPPALVFLLLLSFLFHVWLYVIHGAIVSIYEVMTTPAHLLVAVPLALVAGMFHEFGHAAALRYGRGQVRGMGIGFYLIYPTFYTDVTDAYRLHRRARLRTDLGGVYFHLIFSLAVIAASLLLHQEYLLSVAVLIDLDIVDQFLPFARLDGYWALADLTGVPDLLSQTGPFVRSFLPGLDTQTSRLPALRPGVRFAFALYLAVSLPLLAYFFFQIASNLPSVLTITGTTVFALWPVFGASWSNRDIVSLLSTAAEICLVVLPVLGLVYFVLSLQKPLRAVWKWCQPTALRRSVGAIGSLSAVILLAYVWAPWLPIVPRTMPEGVQHFDITDRQHVDGYVLYEQNPPVAGRHAPIWQNCGFYASPIRNENGVHSLEHGVVWITFQPGLPSSQIDALRQIAHRESYVLVSPYIGLPAPVVVSAWDYQLQLKAVDDPRLEQFLTAFRMGPQAPERGGPCTGGTGTPQ